MEAKNEQPIEGKQAPGWQPSTQRFLWAIGILLALVVILFLIYVGYGHEWTGFGESRIQKKAKTEDVRRAKTLWDSLQFLVVPVVLAGGGILFNWAQDKRTKAIEKRRRDNDLDIEEQRAKNDALQAYFDQMAQLLVSGHLSGGKTDEANKVRILARARTKELLWKLDRHRKRNIMQFLHEAGLIIGEQGNNLIGLSGADLQGAYLKGLDLNSANLAGADMKGADLSGADLRGADLSGADLTGANLKGVKVNDKQLDICSSLEGAIMPNGDKKEVSV